MFNFDITDPTAAISSATSSLSAVAAGAGTFMKTGAGIAISLAFLLLAVGFAWRIKSKAHV